MLASKTTTDSISFVELSQAARRQYASAKSLLSKRPVPIALSWSQHESPRFRSEVTAKPSEQNVRVRNRQKQRQQPENGRAHGAHFQAHNRGSAKHFADCNDVVLGERQRDASK